MKKYFVITLMLFALILFEQSFLSEILGVYLNPLFTLVISYAYLMADREKEAFLASLIGGFFMDMGTTGAVGISSLIFVVAIYSSSIVRKHLFRGMGFQIISIVIFSSFYKVLVNYPSISLSPVLIWGGIINGLLALLSYTFFQRSKNKFLSDEYRIRA